MKNVYPQNVEENKKRDEQERLKEKRALKRQQRVDSVTQIEAPVYKFSILHVVMKTLDKTCCHVYICV